MQTAALSLCPLMTILCAHAQRERTLAPFSLHKDINAIRLGPLKTSLNLYRLLKALSLNAVTSGVTASAYEFGKNTIQSITCTQPHTGKIKKTHMTQETEIKTFAMEKKCKKSKMAVWGGFTNSCEKKRSEKQRRKGKI